VHVRVETACAATKEVLSKYLNERWDAAWLKKTKVGPSSRDRIDVRKKERRKKEE